MGADPSTTIKVPCPDCGEWTAEPIDRVAKQDAIPCSLCGGLIDLSAEDCREAVAQARRDAPD
jgi:predicted RNA-binding Zn-ribbon protein involved in translation (DUF1610 family)